MDFLRRHLFFIICGVGGAAGIALGVTAWRSMPKVMEEMQKVERVHRQLQGLQSSPVNLQRIEAERQRIELVLEDRDRVIARAKELYGYEPLVPDAFPNGNAQALREFRARYVERMNALMDSLRYGGPATAGDMVKTREVIANEEAEAQLTGQNLARGPLETAAGVLTEAGVRKDPSARASIAAAQRIYCYAVHFRDEKPPTQPSSLDVDPTLRDVGLIDAPFIEDAWRAQLGCWIQSDVVRAIAELNDAAARQAIESGRVAWVGIMPVKDVISIRVSRDYVPASGEVYASAPPGGYDAALPPATAESVFTGSASNQYYDVLQYTVKLVMDQRDIPALIDRMTRNKFHTLLRVAYVAIPPNRKLIGKIYGSEPSVSVIMDFEAIMLGDVFRPIMPKEVCDYYGIPCPQQP